MDSTPNGTVIMAFDAAGNAIENVTESVAAMYDLVLQGMDWGSGFFSAEEATPVAKIARLCGFETCDEAERYLTQALKDEAERAERQARDRARKQPS